MVSEKPLSHQRHRMIGISMSANQRRDSGLYRYIPVNIINLGDDLRRPGLIARWDSYWGWRMKGDNRSIRCAMDQGKAAASHSGDGQYQKRETLWLKRRPLPTESVLAVRRRLFEALSCLLASGIHPRAGPRQQSFPRSYSGPQDPEILGWTLTRNKVTKCGVGDKMERPITGPLVACVDG